MNLNELRAAGGVLTGQAVPREVTWKRLDDDGNQVEMTFTVGVVKLGIAAAERIWNVPGERSRCATLIHETIRLGEDFSERIPYEDAGNLDPSLFSALAEVADSINPKPKANASGDAGNG